MLQCKSPLLANNGRWLSLPVTSGSGVIAVTIGTKADMPVPTSGFPLFTTGVGVE
jgi:hypothetical protein